MNGSDENKFGQNVPESEPERSASVLPDGDDISDVLPGERLGKSAAAPHVGASVGRNDAFAASQQTNAAERSAQQASAPGSEASAGRQAASSGTPSDASAPAQESYGQTSRPVPPQDTGAYQAPQNPYPYAGQQQSRPAGDYYRDVYAGGNGRPSSNPYPYANQAYAYEDKPPKKGKAGKIVFFVLLGFLAVVVTAGVLIHLHSVRLNPSSQTSEPVGNIDNVDEVVTASTPEIREASSADALAPVEIYEKVLPSSVGVLVYDSNTKKLASEGSGVIFREDNDGEYTYIITCAHVISDRGVNVMVQLHDEEKYAATVVGYDSRTDIGVVRIKAHGLTACEIGDSDKLTVGSTVYAIGNPGGTEFANSFTNGMVSAIDRPVSSSSTGYTMECIQHTAAINPGNSGGALVNGLGQLIGINSMKIVASDYEGMGFSVPSSVFVKIVNELISNGYVTDRPKIGITYIPAAEEQAYAMFVGIKGLPAGSIIVYSISEDSSLADSKLQKGDLIVAVDGKDMADSGDLAEIVEKSKVGDTLRLSIVRINSDYSYEEFDVTATLVEDKGDTDTQDQEETTTSYFDDYFGNRYPEEEEPGDDYSRGSYSDDYFRSFFDRFFGTP